MPEHTDHKQRGNGDHDVNSDASKAVARAGVNFGRHRFENDSQHKAKEGRDKCPPGPKASAENENASAMKPRTATRTRSVAMPEIVVTGGNVPCCKSVCNGKAAIARPTAAVDEPISVGHVIAMRIDLTRTR